MLSLILASAAVMGSPGPSTVSVTAVGAAFGFRRSLGYMAGLILGTMAVLLAVAAGVVAALLAVPYATPVLTTVAALYILYLAYKIATAPPLSKLDPARTAPSIAGGFLLAVANPKAYVAIAAVVAGTALAPASPALDIAMKTAVLGLMIVLIHVAWLGAGVSLARLLYDPVRSRIVNVLLAAALVATAVPAFMR
jgi:threonine/homoserine/homoserine lactone efflux protein